MEKWKSFLAGTRRLIKSYWQEKKSVHKKLSRKHLTVITGIVFLSVLTIIGIYIKYMPCDGDSDKKTVLQLRGINYTEAEFVKYAGRNDMEIVDIFLDSGMNINSSRNSDGFTPLIAAASYNRVEMVEYLLARSADINLADFEGQTALMKAVKYNRVKMVEILLNHGADYNLTDSRGNTALSIFDESLTDSRIKQVFSDYGLDVSKAKEKPPKKTQND